MYFGGHSLRKYMISQRVVQSHSLQSHGTIDLYHNSLYRLALMSLSTYRRCKRLPSVQVQYMGFVQPSGALIFA